MNIQLDSKDFVEEIVTGVISRLKPQLQNNSHQDDTIFDITGLCKYLNVSKAWVYKKTHLKEIPHHKIDGVLLFRKKEIDRLLEQHKVPVLDNKKQTLGYVK